MDQVVYYNQTNETDFTSLTVKFDGGILFRKGEGKYMWSVAKRNGQWETFGTKKVSNGKILSLEKVPVPKNVFDEGKCVIRSHLKSVEKK